MIINPAILAQYLQYAREKSNVATGRDREPIIGDVGAEQSAAGGGRHPITLHARLTIWIDDDDFGSELFGFVQVFGGHRLSIGSIRAEKDDQIRAVPILVAASTRCNANSMFHRGGAWGMA